MLRFRLCLDIIFIYTTQHKQFINFRISAAALRAAMTFAVRWWNTNSATLPGALRVEEKKLRPSFCLSAWCQRRLHHHRISVITLHCSASLFHDAVNESFDFNCSCIGRGSSHPLLCIHSTLFLSWLSCDTTASNTGLMRPFIWEFRACHNN